MTTQLVSPSIAILAANGFDEKHMTAVQRAMTKDKMTYKVVAPEQGLVNGWQDNAWGHYFAVDEVISGAMGSDYDILILIGGERGTAKLKTNLHARRIINHFLEAGKPVAALGTGVELLALSAKSASLTVSAPSVCSDSLRAAQITVSEEAQTLDGVVLSSNGADIDPWLVTVMQLVAAFEPEVDEDAQAA